MDRGAWWATVHRVSKSRTGLKRLSMHTHKFTKVTNRQTGDLISYKFKIGKRNAEGVDNELISHLSKGAVKGTSRDIAPD